VFIPFTSTFAFELKEKVFMVMIVERKRGKVQKKNSGNSSGVLMTGQQVAFANTGHSGALKPMNSKSEQQL
jgi:hypothetical protein